MTPLLEAFSAALLHFAWQGCLVMALLWVMLFVLRSGSAKARYAAGCVALAVLAVAPLLTTYALYREPPPPSRRWEAPMERSSIAFSESSAWLLRNTDLRGRR